MPDKAMLPVSVPTVTGIESRDRAASPTAHRLGCTVASLFGVGLNDVQGVRPTAQRYEDVSLKEIGTGAPVGVADRTVDEISGATLNRYKPDRKAGALLAGANVLFGSLLPIFDEVITTIGATDDGGDLNAETRLGIWATFVQEAYRSQPALFVAAVTARRTQRALASPWLLVDTSRTPTAPSSAPRTSPDVVIDTLNILDATLSQAFRPTDVTSSAAHASLLREDIIERWVNHLIATEDGGIAWTSVTTSGDIDTEAFVSSLNALNAFLDEFAQASVVNTEDPSLQLPRLPSPGELRRLSPSARRMAIFCSLQIHRVVRDNPRYNRADEAFQKRVTDEAEKLSHLAVSVLGRNDPLSALAHSRWLNKAIVDIRERQPKDAARLARELAQVVDELGVHFDAKTLDGGTYADQCGSLSAILSSIQGDAASLGDHQLTELLQDVTSRLWLRFCKATRLPELTLEDGTLRPMPEWFSRLAGHLHDFAAVLMNSGSDADADLAIVLLRDHVIPARFSWGETYGVYSPYRQSIQLLIRAIDRRLSEADGSPEADELAQTAVDMAAILLELPEGKAAASGTPTEELRSGQINTITAILIGLALADEHGISSPRLEGTHVDQLVDRALQALARRQNPEIPTGRLLETSALVGRLRRSSPDDGRPAPKAASA